LEIKVCSSCGESFPLKDFYKKLNGLAASCKWCQRASKKKYYKENKEILLERNKKVHSRIKGKRYIYMKKYREAHKEEFQFYISEYRKKQ
jgi:hypothetical protein